MHRDVQDLARRFKLALDAVERDHHAASARRARVLAEARAAREELLDELRDFASATGHLGVERSESGLVFRYRDQQLTLTPEGDGDRLRVSWTHGHDGDPPIAVYRHPEADFVWILAVGQPGSEAVERLFPTGLIHLLTEGLGLPAPLPVPPAPQPPLDALVPEERD